MGRAFARTLQKSLARSQIGGSVPHDTVTFWQRLGKEWRGFTVVLRHLLRQCVNSGGSFHVA